jgi:hypothetical protein
MEFLDINLTEDSSLLLHGYSESFLLADFTENQNLHVLWFKNPYKKICELENLSLMMNSIFWNGKTRVENHPRNLLNTSPAFKNSISGISPQSQSFPLVVLRQIYLVFQDAAAVLLRVRGPAPDHRLLHDHPGVLPQPQAVRQPLPLGRQLRGHPADRQDIF